MNASLFTLETERLLLRPLEMSDAEAMFAMDHNPNVHKYLWKKPTQTIDETIKIIEYIQEQYKRNQIGRYATMLKETGAFIGWTGIKYIDDHVENGNTNFFDYGYRLAEEYWGQGYATEATKAWLDHGFNQMNIQNMHAYTHHENGASNHILRKAGFEFMHEYTADDGICWNWWQFLKSNYQPQ